MVRARNTAELGDRLPPATPIAWTPALMCDRRDEHFVFTNPIEQSKWIAREHVSAFTTPLKRPTLG